MTRKELPSSDETIFNVNSLKISQIWHTMKISHIFTASSVEMKDVGIIQNLQKQLGLECSKEVLSEKDL